jgi:putative transposase
VHCFVSCLLHVVFSTKERRPSITPSLQEQLWPYLGGISHSNKLKALKVGGVADHVHMLSLPATLDVAKAVQLLNGRSSRWVHETFPDQQAFEWQEGYGAFSIGISGIADTLAYIENQAEHHKRITFQEELASILRNHGIEFEPAMLD